MPDRDMSMDEWLAWYGDDDGVRRYRPQRSKYGRTLLPQWAYSPSGDDGDVAYGSFSDGQWARTVIPNPRYL